jgi:type III secretion system FlhB-like substrate exporter
MRQLTMKRMQLAHLLHQHEVHLCMGYRQYRQILEVLLFLLQLLMMFQQGVAMGKQCFLLAR